VHAKRAPTGTTNISAYISCGGYIMVAIVTTKTAIAMSPDEICSEILETFNTDED
jgi:hypothetical protein